MNSLRPLLVFILMSKMLVFSACDMNNSEECLQEIIDDPSYFSVDRVLSNTCTKQQGIDYVLTGNHTYTITSNVFIEAGTIIEIADSASLVIEPTGTLQATGTTADPVIIRGQYQSAGHWRGLVVRSNSALNQLSHVQLQDAGGAPMIGETACGALVLLDQGRIAINNTKITNSASYGINMASTTAILSEINNSSISNTVAPIRLHTTQAGSFGEGNNFAGNQRNYLEFCIVPFTNETHTWSAVNVPYRLMAADSNSSAIQTLSGASSLTIEPGTTLEMTPATGFSVRDLSQLTVVGTAAAPILFTGTTKDYSSWEGFEFRFTPQDNRFEQVRIEHAGGQGGVIYMWGDPKITLDGVQLTYSSSCAFYDAPKTSSQAINSNLYFKNIDYFFVNAQYCKGN